MSRTRILRSNVRDDGYRVHNGYLTAPAAGPTLDSLRRRQRDDEYEDEEDPDETIELHNIIPMPSNEEPDYQTGDDEEQSGPDEEIARFPEDQYTVLTEDGHHVVYRTSGGAANRAPNSRTDRFDMGTARDSHSRPPQTLRDLNAFHQAHYARRGRGR